jgi:hypothetical protein
MYLDPKVIKSVIKNSERVDRNTEEDMSRVSRDKKIMVNNSCIDFVKDEKKWRRGIVEGGKKNVEKVYMNGNMERSIKSARMQQESIIK